MAMATWYYILVCYIFTVFTIVSTTTTATNNIINRGFTMNLIHRDSPNSPFYNSSQTHADRIRNSFRRYSKRINRWRLADDEDTVQAVGLDANSGEYLINVSIGSPPVQNLVVADTGSGVIWTQCEPCEKCFPQKSPIFNPGASSSYIPLFCSSAFCTSAGKCVNNVCTYTLNYLDTSYSKGHLALETFTLGPVQYSNLVFGCGTDNKDDTDPNHVTAGVIGLDRSSTSLISQLSQDINGKFSYCLAPDVGFGSSIKFGADAIVGGAGVARTPLAVQMPREFYFITLFSISVGSEKFDISSPVKLGNLMVDSGTTYTTIPRGLYNKVAESVARQVKQPVGADPSKLFPLCFETKDDIVNPGLTLHFDGADMVLAFYNYFERVSKEVTCLSILPSDGTSILGNVAQRNFLVGFDLQDNTFSFKGSDCAM